MLTDNTHKQSGKFAQHFFQKWISGFLDFYHILTLLHSERPKLLWSFGHFECNTVNKQVEKCLCPQVLIGKRCELRGKNHLTLS